MAPPAAASGADGGSPSHPPLAGVVEALAPSSLLTASTGDARGEGSESPLAQTDAALSPAPGAVPRSAADVPEAASGASSADSQPQGSISSSGASGDGACSAADAPVASSVAPGALRFSSVRWDDSAGLWHCASPAPSTASTASLPSPPVVSRGITPGTEASKPVEIDGDGESGADGAAYEVSVAPGGAFSFPVVSQPRRDGRLPRAASTTAGLCSMAEAKNEAAPDALVLGLMTPSSTPATTQASVHPHGSCSSSSCGGRSAVSLGRSTTARAVVTATLSTMPGTGSTAFEPVSALPAPIQGPQPRVRASRKLPDLANPQLEPAFTAPGTQEAWCEILNARIPQPITSDRVTECSVSGIQAFADWEDPAHPWQRLRARLPESPCTFGADGFMPNKPISIRDAGHAIVVKLWRQFAGRTVGRTEHSDLGFALWEGAHWISVAAVEQWLQLGTCVLTVSGPKSPSGSGSGAPRMPVARSSVPEILLEPSMLQYSFETLTWAPSTAAWTVEVVDLDARQPWRNCWVGVPTEHPFNTTFAPCNPSVPHFVPEGTTREEVGAVIVVNPALKQSHLTASWVQEFADARAQAAADSSAAADLPSDTSSARTPIPAADRADVQAELGAKVPAQAGLDVLADHASTAEI
ncbi:unnamed protein product [Phytophthora fragariaefolia]|uniref:Unnamed protein product n=1 Tax=Phytophthora fragariaefolia TaxID=1490495 RepID=A0A9W6Y5T2_9STRA|nr:unnamed protein product [Phytophthora fragariaefolia]